MTKSDPLTAPAGPETASKPPILRDLLAWYPFNGTLRDVHAGHDARARIGSAAYDTDRAGTGNAALALAGETGLTFDGIEIAGRSFTIQMWTHDPRQWILCQGIGEDFYGLHIGANDIGLRCDYWGSNQIAPHGAFGGWTHWVIRHDLTTRQRTIWRNATCVATMTSDPYRGTGEFTLGRHFKGAGFFSGRLDDLALWGRALTDAEIGALFAAGVGQSYPG